MSRPLERAPVWYHDYYHTLRCDRCSGYINPDLTPISCRGGMYHDKIIWIEDARLAAHVEDLLNANEKETIWRRLVNQYKLRFLRLEESR